MLTITFSGTQVLLGIALLVLLLLGILWWGKRYFQINEPANDSDAASRTKYNRVDVFRLQPTFLRVGLVCSLAFMFLAFNFTQFENSSDFVQMGMLEEEDWVENAPPITKHQPPPPPPPPQFTAVDDPLLPDTVVFSTMDINDTSAVVATYIKPQPEPVAPTPPPLPVKSKEPEYWVIVEEMPIFGDCSSEESKALRKQCSDRAIMSFISKHVRYPVIARENGVKGTAVIRFVVEKDGSLSGIEIMRDPGAGLGEEAARVVELMANSAPKWTPGKQTGRAVRVQFNLPVRFTLE